MGRLDGKVAIVTGAAQGIGLSVARAYLDEGAKVALVDKNDAVRQVAADLGPNAQGYVADVSNRADVRRVVAETTSDWGNVTILVANAGVTRPAMLWKMTDEQWDTVIDIHLKGSWICTQEVLAGMRAEGWGRLVYVTSSAGINGTIGQCNYAAAKGGILSLMRSAARELAGEGIVANAVAPAAATPMTETIRTDERFRDTYLERIPMKRWAEPDELTPTFVYLASDDCSYLTGQVLSADGGMTMVR